MDRTTGLSSTRLLVNGMTGVDGRLLMSDLAPAAQRCGFSTEQIRSCLRRMCAEGLFERVGSGREAVYETTEYGRQLRDATRALIAYSYRIDTGAPWDGRWHLVGFAVPEARRAARDAFREHVVSVGGALIQGGLYASPHAWEPLLEPAAKRLGVESCLTLATTSDLQVAGVREPKLIARSLWPIEQLERHYRAYIETYSGVPESLEELLRSNRTLDDSLIIPGALRMTEIWTAHATVDPLLPNELLPQPWPGREARDLLRRSRHLMLAVRRSPDPLNWFPGFDDVLDTQP